MRNEKGKFCQPLSLPCGNVTVQFEAQSESVSRCTLTDELLEHCMTPLIAKTVIPQNSLVKLSDYMYTLLESFLKFSRHPFSEGLKYNVQGFLILTLLRFGHSLLTPVVKPNLAS